MHVYVAARHIEMGESVRAYIQQNIIETVRNHTSLEITALEVQLFSENDHGMGCHVLVHIKGQHDINVREVDGTLFEAIDVAKNRVLHALTQLRNKILTSRRHPRDERALGVERTGT